MRTREVRKDGGYSGKVEIKNPNSFKAPQVPTGVVYPPPQSPRTESSRPAKQA
ncbi:MAG: hypothetical protein JWN48_1741 [Myxococcaceae bacterium]|nr:hypothetical protein [Myxococcaceae bacterium]